MKIFYRKKQTEMRKTQTIMNRRRLHSQNEKEVKKEEVHNWVGFLSISRNKGRNTTGIWVAAGFSRRAELRVFFGSAFIWRNFLETLEQEGGGGGWAAKKLSKLGQQTRLPHNDLLHVPQLLPEKGIVGLWVFPEVVVLNNFFRWLLQLFASDFSLSFLSNPCLSHRRLSLSLWSGEISSHALSAALQTEHFLSGSKLAGYTPASGEPQTVEMQVLNHAAPSDRCPAPQRALCPCNTPWCDAAPFQDILPLWKAKKSEQGGSFD